MEKWQIDHILATAKEEDILETLLATTACMLQLMRISGFEKSVAALAFLSAEEQQLVKAILVGTLRSMHRKQAEDEDDLGYRKPDNWNPHSGHTL